jgi:Flp pilus assembly protein TadG
MRRDRGSVAPFMAVVAIALVLVAGLVYDGGRIVAAQATARDVASSAARAGAQQVDLQRLRSDGAPVLAPDRATDAARAVLDAAGIEGEVVVDAATVTVTAAVRQPMLILPLEDRTVRATDTATATAGLTTEEP